MMMASLVRKTWLLTEREDDSTATSKAKEANALTASKGPVICQSVLKLRWDANQFEAVGLDYRIEEDECEMMERFPCSERLASRF